jgi:outer membrane lipoprotein-sorting protein
MLKLISVLGLILTASFAFADEAEDLLKAYDANRAIENFAFEMEMSSYQGERLLDSYVLSGFMEGEGLKSKTLLYFESPAVVRDRRMLMDGNIIWIQFPRTQNPIRLTPMQVLLGEAANGDVARTSFTRDYDAADAGIDTRDGKACRVLALTVKPESKGATYGSIKLWGEEATKRPVYAEFYADSGKLLKTAKYGDYREWNGRSLPMTMDISDAQDPERHTTMKYIQLGSRKLPEQYFRKEYLPRFSFVPLDRDK